MKKEVFDLVAPLERRRLRRRSFEIALVDVGAKDNMVRSLLERGVSVRRIPWTADLREEVSTAYGVVIGNGPGDPRDLDTLVEQVCGLLASYKKPIFGICLGNQILARAAAERRTSFPMATVA